MPREICRQLGGQALLPPWHYVIYVKEFRQEDRGVRWGCRVVERKRVRGRLGKYRGRLGFKS